MDGFRAMKTNQATTTERQVAALSKSLRFTAIPGTTKPRRHQPAKHISDRIPLNLARIESPARKPADNIASKPFAPTWRERIALQAHKPTAIASKENASHGAS